MKIPKGANTRTTLARMTGMVAVLAVFPGWACGQSTEALGLADRLFERAGLAVQLQSLPAQFEQGLSQNPSKLPDEVMAALAEAGKKSFAVATLREEVVPALARTLPAADIKEILDWLDGQVGRRMTLAEESATGNMTPENMQAYFESEKQKPASPERVKLIAGLIEATRAVEIGATFIEAMALGIAVGMDATEPVEKRIGITNLRARLRAALPPAKLRASVGAALPAMEGFTYRRISDADLAAYVKFNDSALGRRYNQAVTKALAESLTRASMRIGETLKTAPGKEKV